MSDYKIELIESKDVPAVRAFLKGSLYKDEPMATYLKINDCEELVECSVASIPDNCSFKAVNSKGEIIGTLINSIVKRPAPNVLHLGHADICKHEICKIYLKFVEFICTQFNLFDSYPDVDEYLEAGSLSVDKNYRGQGIAFRLTERTFEYMLANNIPIACMICTSRFSARVCEKLNFKREYALNFADYFVDGKNPILPAEPHKTTKVFAKVIK